MLNLRTFYTLYYTVLAYDGKLTQQGSTNKQPAATCAAAEADAVREQQLKMNTIREQLGLVM